MRANIYKKCGKKWLNVDNESIVTDDGFVFFTYKGERVMFQCLDLDMLVVVDYEELEEK